MCRWLKIKRLSQNTQRPDQSCQQRGLSGMGYVQKRQLYKQTVGSSQTSKMLLGVMLVRWRLRDRSCETFQWISWWAYLRSTSSFPVFPDSLCTHVHHVGSHTFLLSGHTLILLPQIHTQKPLLWRCTTGVQNAKTHCHLSVALILM